MLTSNIISQCLRWCLSDIELSEFSGCAVVMFSESTIEAGDLIETALQGDFQYAVIGIDQHIGCCCQSCMQYKTAGGQSRFPLEKKSQIGLADIAVFSDHVFSHGIAVCKMGTDELYCGIYAIHIFVTADIRISRFYGVHKKLTAEKCYFITIQFVLIIIPGSIQKPPAHSRKNGKLFLRENAGKTAAAQFIEICPCRHSDIRK